MCYRENEFVTSSLRLYFGVLFFEIEIEVSVGLIEHY